MTLPASAPPAAPGTPPAVLPPAADVFLQRATRFAELAAGHALGDWLAFLGRLSAAQHACLQKMPAPALPSAAALALAHEHRMPPVPAQSWPRDPVWRTVLHCLCDDLVAAAPDALRSQLAALPTRPVAEIETLADRVLHTELYGDDAAVLPIVAAALQVYWTHMAHDLPALAPLDVPGICPCCGFLPVGSIVKSVGEIGSLRYLHCALCNTEWNLVRVKCAACDATAGISYRQLEGPGLVRPDAVKAETCDSCKSYLKIVYVDRGGRDPVADDLATLALDILVDAAGYARAGPNLFYVPGNG